MSAGAFSRSFYENDEGTLVFPIRVQPETLEATISGTQNQPAAEVATAGLPTVNVSAGVRENGVIPRKVTVTLAATATAPDGYKGEPLQIVALSKAWFDLAIKGAAVTYLGTTWVVLSTRREEVN